jgi:phosphoenolpyruvate carboxylase
MPYRMLVDLMRGRLKPRWPMRPAPMHRRTSSPATSRLILRSLADNGLHAGWFLVRRLAWRVRTFGFHLARLDVRQNRACMRVRWPTHWAMRNGRRAMREQAGVLSRSRPVPRSCRPARRRATRGWMRCSPRWPMPPARPDALGIYIISMAHTRADVLTVLALARRGGLVDADGACRWTSRCSKPSTTCAARTRCASWWPTRSTAATCPHAATCST